MICIFKSISQNLPIKYDSQLVITFIIWTSYGLKLKFFIGELGFAEIHLGSAAVIKSPDYPKSLGPQVQMEWR